MSNGKSSFKYALKYKNYFWNFPENRSSAPLSNSAPGVGPEKKTSAPGVVIEKIR